MYWPFRTSRIVQLYLAIDDQDEENGAMKMIDGSHRLGKLEWHDTQSDLNDAEGMARSSWLWQQIDDAEDPKAAVVQLILAASVSQVSGGATAVDANMLASMFAETR